VIVSDVARRLRRGALGVLVAVLTAFYMFRLVFVGFLGEGKSDAASHAHESPPVMLWPLRLLALFSIIGGAIGIEALYNTQFDHSAEHLSFAQQLFAPFTHFPLAASIGLLAAIAGFSGAYVLYSKAAADPLPSKIGSLSQAMRNKFYFDELYEATVIPLHDLIAKIADFFDRWIVEGFCIGFVRWGTDLAGRSLRGLQTGNLQAYALIFALGVAVVLYLVLR